MTVPKRLILAQHQHLYWQEPDVKVAKHGNRAVSSKTGSADLLEELGVNISSTPNEIDYLLEHVGIAFLFAPAMHPALKRIMKIRKELNVPTIFNLIGPLTNP